MAEYEMMLSFRIDKETLNKLDDLVAYQDHDNTSLYLRELINKAYLDKLADEGFSIFSKANKNNWDITTHEARALFVNHYKWLFNLWLRKIKRRK